jgi:adenine-specific DNA-methyltransferase
MATSTETTLLEQFKNLNAQQLRRLLVEHLTKQKLGLYWESNAIERDASLNANVVLPRLVPAYSHTPEGITHHRNLIIEGDNFDSLRLLRATHAGKIRVIFIDPPYNTGNKDWVYNDKFVGANDRWRHSQWLEFLYRRLTLARELLTSDGVILVSINDENRARLELLMDEVFPGRKLGSFVWKTRSGSNDEQALFSVDHEHVLVYGQPVFKFRGEDKDFAQYKNPDCDLRGRWKTGDLGQGKTLVERPNAYYPIQNPKTGVWYPCNPAVVWRFASESRVDDVSTLRAKTMEQYIREDKVIFPDEKTERVQVWETKAALLEAIEKGDVPLRPKTKTPLLTADLPDLDYWVGKPVGFGRPWFKRHLNDVQSDLRPVSSWIRGSTEAAPEEDWATMLIAQRSGTGELSVNELLGRNAFPYPKPISLIQGLLAQASRPGDTVLDFFAGSGTTGHAVLNLNALDNGNRKFILCSSTEATTKEPNKNLCHDVCAERIKRVITSSEALANNSFAYLQLDKIEAADVAFEATTAHASTLLFMREVAAVPVAIADDSIQIIAKSGDWLIVLCALVTPAAIDALVALPTAHGAARLAVFCPRPRGLAALLQERGVEANTYSIADALMKGQVSGKVKTVTPTPSPSIDSEKPAA